MDMTAIHLTAIRERQQSENVLLPIGSEPIPTRGPADRAIGIDVLGDSIQPPRELLAQWAKLLAELPLEPPQVRLPDQLPEQTLALLPEQPQVQPPAPLPEESPPDPSPKHVPDAGSGPPARVQPQTARVGLQDCMQNRELSWLKFNERVLLEGSRIETPLLERLKFVSIFTTNLTEFFMVRVGSLLDYVLLGQNYRENKTGLTARQQLDEIFRAVSPLYAMRDNVYSAVMEGLSRHGIELLRPRDLPDSEVKALRRHFVHNVQPLLSPQIVDSRHPFPHLANRQLYIAVVLHQGKNTLFGLIDVPPNLDRLVLLEGEEEGRRFVLLEDLICHFADLVFDMYQVVERTVLAVTRNADINMDEGVHATDTDYRQHMKALLKKRQRLSPVRLELSSHASPQMLKFLTDKLKLATPQVYYPTAPIDLSFCFGIGRYLGREALRRLLWAAHLPANPIDLPQPESGGKLDVMVAARVRDLLISYPYESVQPFFDLVSQAAEDPAVLSIKITLYRIDSQSRLAEFLLRAAENGKEVIVLVELRARFDESNNIEWAQRLEEAGCRVIYGMQGFKVHSKVCLITSQSGGRLHYITQIGTGNYNEKTSTQYTDLSLITANEEIGRDAAAFFVNMLLGNLEGNYGKLWVAPRSLKSNLLRCIEEERSRAKAGQDGQIIIKCNSLTDREIIAALVEASQDGVRIQMIVRGICCVIPQIPGLTHNIRVISVVGRFLEHSRIYSFGAGERGQIYISSADLMTRNTQRRVEVACPILDPTLRKRVDDMLNTLLMDNTQAWEQYPDGRYVSRYQPGAERGVNAQELFTDQARMAALQRTDNKRQRSQKTAGRGGLADFWRRLFGG